MSSFLQNQLRNQLAAGFKNKLLSGILTRSQATTLDSYGDPVSSTSETFKVEGFPSQYEEYFRAKFGIPDTDLKIVLIAGNCETRPNKDDVISFREKTYRLRSVKVDPAEATYVCQAYEI